MNREIKFRGYKDRSEPFVYGSLSIKSLRYGSKYEIITLSDDDEGGDIITHIHPESIGQFTGLKDKNGVDIYEGDIVKWKTRRFKSVYTGLKEDRDKLQSITWKSPVEWDMQCFCITESFDPIQRNNSPLVEDETLEVVGNIHQNPELL